MQSNDSVLVHEMTLEACTQNFGLYTRWHRKCMVFWKGKLKLQLVMKMMLLVAMITVHKRVMSYTLDGIC